MEARPGDPDALPFPTTTRVLARWRSLLHPPRGRRTFSVVKRVLLAEGLLDAEVPVDWVVRATTLANGQRIEVAVPEKYAEWGLDHLPEDLTTIVYRTNAPFRELAEAQMRRHVGNGEPERFDDLVGTVPAHGYQWTDGVHDIATWFVQPADRIVVAIYVTLPGLIEPWRTDRDPVARGRALLSSARWVD